MHFHQDENDISPTVVVQDNPFTFSENLTSEGLQFDEERNMYELFTISAEDGDISDEFGKDSVEFSISTNVPLEVDSVTGVVYAPESAFDYETNSNHTVRITATDSRENPELSQVSSPFLVTINVGDVNDEIPRLTSLDGTQFCIYENTNPDGLDCSLLDADGRVPLLEAVFLASDADAGSEITASIDWDQTEASSGFVPVTPEQCQLPDILYLNQSEPDAQGTVTIKILLGDSALLDRECVDTVNMVIEITDENSDSVDTASSYLPLSVLIADLDDNPPVFDNWELLDFTINENSDKSDSEFEPTNLTQFTIIVSDPDDVDPYFEVALVPLNPATPYIVVPEDRDNTSPDIVLLQNLKIDREDAEIMESDGVLQYIISVIDAGGNFANRLVILSLSRLC